MQQHRRPQAASLSYAAEMRRDVHIAIPGKNPASLAMALAKMRRREQLLLEARFPGARLLRVPALLRDHPATEERIRRLRAMPQGPDGEANGDRRPLEPAGEDRSGWPWE